MVGAGSIAAKGHVDRTKSVILKNEGREQWYNQQGTSSHHWDLFTGQSPQRDTKPEGRIQIQTSPSQQWSQQCSQYEFHEWSNSSSVTGRKGSLSVPQYQITPLTTILSLVLPKMLLRPRSRRFIKRYIDRHGALI